MGTDVPLCATTSLSSFVNGLRQSGASVEAALQRARLPVAFEDEPQGWIPYVRMRRFVADVVARESLHDIGARAASTGSAESVAPTIRRLLLGAPTLMNALQAASWVAGAQSTHLKVWIEPHGPYIRVCHANAVGPEVPGYPAVEAHTTAVLVTIARQHLGRHWKPSRIVVRRPGLLSSATHALGQLAIDGTDLLMHDHHGGIDVPVEQVWTANTRHGIGDADGEAEAVPPESIGAAVRGLVRAYLLDGRPGVALIAELLEFKPRELQRRLALEHTSFRQAVALARFDAARKALADEHVPLTEIALMVGFSEQSAFTRAFRSWTGVSPGAYRARLLRRGGGTRDERALH